MAYVKVKFNLKLQYHLFALALPCQKVVNLCMYDFLGTV